MCESSGTTRGRSSYLLAALVWLVSVTPVLSSTNDDKPGFAPVIQVPPPNLVGSMHLRVQAHQIKSEAPWLRLSMSSGANKPSDTNGFYANAVVLEHTYFRFDLERAADFAAALREWYDTPHSDVVYRVPGGPIGFSSIGNAWSDTLDPVVIVTVLFWVVEGLGEIHGGNYFVLTRPQAIALAEAIEVWLANPAASDDALFEASVQ